MSGAGPLQTDYFRYRRGKTNSFVSPPIDTAELIRVGHIVFRDIGDANKYKSVDVINDIGAGGPANLAVAQELVHDDYAGISSERSEVGEVLPLKINATGVFEMECAAAQFQIGQLVGVALLEGSSTTLDAAKVVSVAAANLAIARVVKDYPANTTTVEVEIVSSKTLGGPQNIV